MCMGSSGDFGCANAYIYQATRSRGANYVNRRGVTSASDTGQTLDYMVSFSVAGSTVAETIPTATASGRVLIFKDKSGAAATNGIVITPSSGTIDGSASFTISTNYGCVTLIDDTTNDWSVVSRM